MSKSLVYETTPPHLKYLHYTWAVGTFLRLWGHNLIPNFICYICLLLIIIVVDVVVVIVCVIIIVVVVVNIIIIITMCDQGGLDHLPPKFEHIFVAVITFSHFLLCRYLLLPACCLLCVL